jgi:hypothetical protein
LADGHGEGVHRVLPGGVVLLEEVGEDGEERLPHMRRYGVQATVEAAL